MKHFPSEEIAMGMTTVESQLSVVNYAKGMTSLIYILGYIFRIYAIYIIYTNIYYTYITYIPYIVTIIYII